MGQLDSPPTVVRAVAAVVTVVRATVVAVVAMVVGATVVGAAVVVVAIVVLVVVEVLVVVLLLVAVVLELVVELDDVDTSIAGASATTGDGAGGCSANGAVTKPSASRLPKTPSGSCAHVGQPRNAAQNNLAEATAKPPPYMRPNATAVGESLRTPRSADHVLQWCHGVTNSAHLAPFVAGP